MKNILILFFLSAGYFCVSQTVTPVASGTSKLFCMDIFAVAPYNFKGVGGGMGIFSPSVLSEKEGYELRFGGDFYFSGLERHSLRDVPLSSPQSGMAKVKLAQTFLAFNISGRLTLPLSGKVSPYLDGFAGARGISTDITITPYEYKIGYEKSSTENLSSVFKMHYGIGVGVLTKLGKDIRLNTGIVYSYAPEPGSTYDIYTAKTETGSLQMTNADIPKGMLMFKLGITGLFDGFDVSEGCGCCETRSRGVIFSNPSGGSNLKSNSISTGTRIMK